MAEIAVALSLLPILASLGVEAGSELTDFVGNFSRTVRTKCFPNEPVPPVISTDFLSSVTLILFLDLISGKVGLS